MGSNPALPASATVNDNLAMQFDFRSVYATLLEDWFGAPAGELSAVLLKPFQKLPLIAPSAVLSAGEGQELPRDYGLDQNYPNPFNPSTTIAVNVPWAAPVSVVIYNILGQEVRIVQSGPLEAGRYLFRWDGNNDHGAFVGTGVYLCRMTVPGGPTFVRKMLLLK